MTICDILNKVFNNRQDNVLNLILEYGRRPLDDYKSLYQAVITNYWEKIHRNERTEDVYWKYKCYDSSRISHFLIGLRKLERHKNDGHSFVKYTDKWRYEPVNIHDVGYELFDLPARLK